MSQSKKSKAEYYQVAIPFETMKAAIGFKKTIEREHLITAFIEVKNDTE